ncbi:RluA family pseudouridine synthase [Polluticaenibacter yanchengensis]|uniref:Pseudouridine synthase n=1 Tax=Polluticaenibacter yanchengensis TaxID=3014562 RepID=A0ABT4UFU6_9BACT|nr:RluA family pseudouridine synthase [Chitinophagaceae bacterium LY-5]
MSEEIIDQIDNDEADELYEKLTLTIDKGQEPLRVDKFVWSRLENVTRNKIQNGIKNGLVTVNGKTVKVNHKIKPGDELVIYTDTAPDANDIIPEKMPLDIFYEDDDIIVINKQPGLVVHPGSGNPNGTLVNGIAYYLQQQNPELGEEALPRFGLVHRIDKNTSGLLLLAKKESVLQHLAKQFFDHTVQRKYIALVWGNIEEDEGTIVAHVGRSPRQRKMFEAFPDGDHGKEAITHFKVLERFHYVTLVECVLETGRTHQIRVHMKYIGHTLFADDHYGGDKILKGTIYNKYKQFVENCFKLCNRQALHAKTLGFVHPTTGKELFFDSDIPEDMQLLIEKWRKYYNNKGLIADDE